MKCRRHRFPGYPCRAYCVEPLEERWLLSRLAVPASRDAEHPTAAADITRTEQDPNRSVDLIELAISAPELDNDVPIEPSSLPKPIVDTFDAQFPGARIIQADRTNEGDGTEYDMLAEWNGETVGMTMRADGTVRELEHSLEVHDLPRPVINWVETAFPGATIKSADIVVDSDQASFELLFADKSGQNFEATVRLPAADSASLAGTLGATVQPQIDSALLPYFQAISNTTVRELIRSGPAAVELAVPEHSNHPEPTVTDPRYDVAYIPPSHRADLRDETRDDYAADSADSDRAGTPRTAAPDAQSAVTFQRHSESLAAAARAPAGPSVRRTATGLLPEVAGAIREMVPTNVAAAERAFQKLLDGIGSLTDQVACDTILARPAIRVSIIAGLILGIELLVLDSRKAVRRRTHGSLDTASSWSWILGAALPKRR